MHKQSHDRGPRKRRERKVLRKYSKRQQLKYSLTWESKQLPKSRKCRVPARIIQRRNTLRHIVIKLTKIKNENLFVLILKVSFNFKKLKKKNIKSNKGKTTNNTQGKHIKLSADFSAETLQARREWHNTFKLMKGKKLQPRILYPARSSFRFDRESKTSTQKWKARRILHLQTSFAANAEGACIEAARIYKI